ncbi:hypothetical protein EW145_g4096 [Phellinidium pouzarii]|uniref:Ribonuclease n=1 Tax=Phellinidium pouzarii TaxID=167371 RepID=A0A4S4L4Z1_9AGAM|nr:hypothetical protein EW145_g4096 [Phellinidium pouzarii]
MRALERREDDPKTELCREVLLRCLVDDDEESARGVAPEEDSNAVAICSTECTREKNGMSLTSSFSKRVATRRVVSLRLALAMSDTTLPPELVESQESEIIESQDGEPLLISADDAHAVPSLPRPFAPLTATYSYHSEKPTVTGPYMLGVDEAGRGPVLGPMVYGVAYCPVAFTERLDELGFADSKTLSHDSRASLLEILSSEPENLAWASENATVTLIQEVLGRGIQLSEVYVDALGNTTTYERYLSKMFPGIAFTVTAKADSKFKIVGAASVAAKVTRDAWVTGWAFEEHESSPQYTWPKELGSGYPSDPKTQAWLRDSLEPTFGFPSLVRFSWATVKVALEKYAHAVKWIDEGQASLVKAFETSKGKDKGRCILAKELSMKNVVDL